MIEYENIKLFKDIQYTTIKTNKKVEYINLASGFDIETTSLKLKDEKIGFMYIWMFGISDKNHICYGRTWDDFIKLCEDLQEYYHLNSKKRLIVYIHNFSYEFQFMRKYFTWENTFNVSERKPIKALTSYGIEFRDSYILSGYSLAKTAENLNHKTVKKLVGDLDYRKIRNSKTTLTPLELSYCHNDIEIILAYINEQIEMYQDISKIPLTNTGRVRKYVKDNCYFTNTNHKKSSGGKFSRYRNIMNDLTLTKDDYIMLKRAFGGGFTHANANFVGQTLDNVGSFDFTSSYPAVMLSEMFPMSKSFTPEINNMKDFEDCLQKYCLVFDLELTNVLPKINQDNYISQSKCFTLDKPVINNGRVNSCDRLETTVTNVDYQIIEQCYKWEKMRIRHVKAFHKGYLPKPIILSILKLYGDKTKLKGVSGKEVEYLLSKGMINSVYGMCVTDIVKDEVTYTNEWGIEKADIQEQIEKYNDSKNRFLFYAWGIFVTAYARKNLFNGILNVGDDYIYSDTDSIKILNVENHLNYIEIYNKKLVYKLKKMCDVYNIDFELMKPKTIKGETKLIGVWDYEGTYKRFKTLGAKRYIVEDKNGDMEITIAGLSKQNGLKYMLKQCNDDNTKVFKMFNDDLLIPSNETGKLTHTYIDDPKTFICEDFQGNKELVQCLSGIHLENCEFTLSISKQYGTFLKALISGYVYKGVKYV